VKTKIGFFWLFPLLGSAYPVLALVGANIGQVRLVDAWRIVVVSISICVFLLAVFYLLIRNMSKAAVLATVVLAIFFSYGHIYGVLENITLGDFIIGRHRFLIPVTLLTTSGLVCIILKEEIQITKKMSGLLNLVFAFLLLIPLYQISSYEIRISKAKIAQPIIETKSQNPDIFYIILDGYNREDTLKDLYGFDNSSFLESLRTLGFTIPRCSQSNYGWTSLSLASTFQMNYLEDMDLGEWDPSKDMDWTLIHERIRNNPVRDQLSKLGYEVISFSTGYPFTEWIDSDKYITPSSKKGQGLTAFEALFIRTTLVRPIIELTTAKTPQVIKEIDTMPDKRKYDQIMFTLSKLEELAVPTERPRFIYAHIMAPHKNYVFDKYGNFVVQEQIPGYTDSVAYLNTRILEIVNLIIANADTRPIIIIQSDHGWDWERRLANLNALYLPQEAIVEINDNWTPVNTFRLVFRTVFLLPGYSAIENQSYYSTPDDPEGVWKIDFSCVEN